jgi:hypothetical protein
MNCERARLVGCTPLIFFSAHMPHGIVGDIHDNVQVRLGNHPQRGIIIPFLFQPKQRSIRASTIGFSQQAIK